MKAILVTGGAGYIGSHMCKYLANKGYYPVVLDNLVHGHREAVKWGVFYCGSIQDQDLLQQIFNNHNILAVMHFAAYCYVGESVEKPGKYYRNNVANTLRLLETMLENNIGKIIFSSSCSIFGEPDKVPIGESHPQNPINPYGRSKLMVERILDDMDVAHGLKSIRLRYFNAAGADPDGELGEDHEPETHLIPLVLKTALGQRDCVNIFGTDYPTADGTCVRDYIHINDLAQAHLLGLEKLLDGSPGGCFNLGIGKGYSINEVIETAGRVAGKTINSQPADRRPGDPATLITTSEKAIRELGWSPRYSDLHSIIETAWRWHRNNPHGWGG